MFKKIFNTIFAYVFNFFTKKKIIFVSDSADWVIKEVGKELACEINKITQKEVMGMSVHHFGLRNKIIHFGAAGTIFIKGRPVRPHSSNRVILSWYHILDDDSRLAYIPELNSYVDIVHTSCSLTRDKLVGNGFDSEKVMIIPQSVDTRTFFPYPSNEREEIRKSLGFAGTDIVIGSFQKDGSGWSDGMQPKLEKGPDIFCEVIIALAKKYPIRVLLTGPARGYVKKRLGDAGVTFLHAYVEKQSYIVKYYNALDLYIVASRVEGGPKAIIEGMACGIPLVTTCVGMAKDIIKDGVNGLIVPVGDINGLIDRSVMLIENSQLRQKCVLQAFDDIKNMDHGKIAQQYWEGMYVPLFSKI